MNKKLLKNYAAKMTRESGGGQKFSPSQAEEEIVRVIRKVSRILAPSFKFGYHGVEDIEEEGVLAALEVLEEDKYDIARPLENFLYSHVHNQLHNYKRKHYARIETPCHCCDPHDPPAYPCQKYVDWQARNSAKRNLMQPLDMSNVCDESEKNMRMDSDVVGDTIGSELRTLLDQELPVELRRDYLKMLEGSSLPKVRRDRVKEAVIKITRERGYLDATEESVA